MDPHIAKTAARAVALNANDAADALLMLDILGLIPPQPGYLPYDSKELQDERRAKGIASLKKLRKQQREKREETNKVNARLKKHGVTLDEIGEPEGE